LTESALKMAGNAGGFPVKEWTANARCPPSDRDDIL